MNETVVALIEDEIKTLTGVQEQIGKQIDIAKGDLAQLEEDWERYDKIVKDLAEALDAARCMCTKELELEDLADELVGIERTRGW